MNSTATDKWSDWLLHRRFGGNEAAAERGMRMLYRVRDSVLDEAKLRAGQVLLDVGCGDGLIAFGALDRVAPDGRVIFADISEPLLERCRGIAAEAGLSGRCEFVQCSANDLRAIGDRSVDVVTTRSVLIYVHDKEAALREFHRVLKPGGRISLWEPINRFNETYRPEGNRFAAGAPEVADLATRIEEYFRRLQPIDSDPMMDFDERDLLRMAESAGFPNVHVSLQMHAAPAEPVPWDAFLNMAGNPNIPSMGAVMNEILTDEERARFERHVRPLVEAGGRPARSATVAVVATKAKEG